MAEDEPQSDSESEDGTRSREQGSPPEQSEDPGTREQNEPEQDTGTTEPDTRRRETGGQPQEHGDRSREHDTQQGTGGQSGYDTQQGTGGQSGYDTQQGTGGQSGYDTQQGTGGQSGYDTQQGTGGQSGYDTQQGTGNRSQGQRAQRQGTQGQRAQRQGTQSGQEKDSVLDGVSRRAERFREMFIWPESVIAGVAVWLAGFILHFIPIWWLGVGEDGILESALDGTILVYYESLGGSLTSEIEAFETLATTTAYQSALDSDAFGVAPAVHMVVPALVLLIGGHVLAGRHIRGGRAKRPMDAILAGMSLAIWFTVVLFLSVLLASTGETSVNLVEVFVMTLLYSGMFAAIGATIRSRSGLSSGWGILGGIGAAVVSFSVWFLVGNPFGTITDRGLLQEGILEEQFRAEPESFSDLEGLFETVALFMGFVTEHGLETDTVLPAWFVILVPLVTGAALAYVYKRRDPLVGFGEGAKLGVGYFVPVFVVVVAYVGGLVQELESTYDEWPTTEPNEFGADAVDIVNQLGAVAPRSILLAGIVYPVLFGAIGGAIGAVVYDRQRATDEQPEQPTGGHRQEPREPSARADAGQRPSERPRQTTEPDPQYQQSDQQYQTGQEPHETNEHDREPSGRTGEGDQPTETNERDREPSEQEPGSSADEEADSGPDEEDNNSTDAAGEELSPGDIVGDDIDDDTEDS